MTEVTREQAWATNELFSSTRHCLANLQQMLIVAGYKPDGDALSMAKAAHTLVNTAWDIFAEDHKELLR